MKVFRCFKCNTILGEMSKGKIKTNAKLLCATCYKDLTINDAAKAFGDVGDSGLGDVFNDIFKKD